MKMETMELYVDYGPSWLDEPPHSFVRADPRGDGTFVVTEISQDLTLVPGDVLLATPAGHVLEILEARPVLVAMVGLGVDVCDVDIDERVAMWNRAAYAVKDSDLVAFVATTDARWLAENVQSDPAVVLFELERTPASNMDLDALVERRFQHLRQRVDDDFQRWMEETD